MNGGFDMARDDAPIIVRRRKVQAAASHHGGAWKVAIVRVLSGGTLWAPGLGDAASPSGAAEPSF